MTILCVLLIFEKPSVKVMLNIYRDKQRIIAIMEAKIDNTDVEGQFARPDIFDKKGVMGRMDNKFPFHPLERSEAKYAKCSGRRITLVGNNPIDQVQQER